MIQLQRLILEAQMMPSSSPVSLPSMTDTVGPVLLLGLIFAVGAAFLLAAHVILTLPMRRAERARLFLDLLERALREGRPVEETMISLAESRDLSMGVRFHLLTAYLEQNERLLEALAKVPRFLSPPIMAMLRAGEKIGDLRKVLPACRQLLKDGVSHTRSAINYLVVFAFVITPAGVVVSFFLITFVMPRFAEVFQGGLLMGAPPPGLRYFVFRHSWLILFLQAAVMLLLWLAVLIYAGGARLLAWFPGLGEISSRLPWRRKRMQRDFSTMLAILLDSGVPEMEAVTLAVTCTANVAFERRGRRVVAKLQQGLALPAAVQAMDDSGEFGWRLTNAIHHRGGFLRTLAGWHESLDAQAFQQEQAAAHGITTSLVLCGGVFVGSIAISVFAFLVSLLNTGVLW